MCKKCQKKLRKRIEKLNHIEKLIRTEKDLMLEKLRGQIIRNFYSLTPKCVQTETSFKYIKREKLRKLKRKLKLLQPQH
jgi:hypothetical protein